MGSTLPVPTPEELDWLRRRWRRAERPIVLARRPRSATSVQIVAADDAEGERWLVLGHLTTAPSGELILSRVSVEHLGWESDGQKRRSPPHNAVEVTWRVMRGIPFADIRDTAVARLAQGKGLIRAMQITGAEPSLWERRRITGAAAVARRPHLKRGSAGYPLDFYREVARILIGLSQQRRPALESFRTEFPKLHPELCLPKEIPLATVNTWKRRAVKEGFLEAGRPGRRGFRPGPKARGKSPDRTWPNAEQSLRPGFWTSGEE